MKLYRVRHPAEPKLFVWWIERRGIVDSSLGAVRTVCIHFAEVREPMTKEDAEQMAAECGGVIEEVKL